MRSLTLPLLVTGPLLLASAQDPAPAEARPSLPPGVVEVRLTPRVPEAGRSLPWSPKGAKLELLPVGAGLAGRLALGPPVPGPSAWPLRLELSKSDGAAHHDRLWLDLDGDGTRGADEVLETVPSENRGKFWSSFEATLALPLPAAEGTRPYPVTLWFVEDPLEPDAAPVLRWSRRGWHEGAFRVGEREVFVLLTESELDGVFDGDDCWSLSPAAETLVAEAGSRSLGRHAWLDETSAWRAVSIDPHGRWVRVEAFDPGVTRAEEEAREDAYAEDKVAPRAPEPLAFGHDYEAAAADALAAGAPLLVDFETTWCGPCKQMDAMVYTAAAVVDAATASGIVAVKVDGDERRDLKERFGVEAFPTMILLDAEGEELRRLVGYQHVADMATFLKVESEARAQR